MSRRDRRDNDPMVQERREKLLAGSILGNVISTNPMPSFPKGGGGGWGSGEKNAKPATGTTPSVNPFMIPKAAGLNIISQTFPSNYYVEWNLSTWRAACDQAIKMGRTMSYATLVSWVFECSPFIQSMFTALSTPLDSTPFFLVDQKGEMLGNWTNELCNKPWQKELRSEILYSYFWGFEGLNFDPKLGKVYKYPMQDIDPINRMLLSTSYSYYDGVNFEDMDNLLFVQPSTNYEKFLGWMQPIARSFIQMNMNKNSWIQAGRRLAFPLMTVGYPQDDGGLDPNGGQAVNPYRIQAENVIAHADPSKGMAYPYTIDAKGNIVKSLEIDFEKTGANNKAHTIYSDFNESEKNEIREMILGGTLTADVGKSGSRALGEVQERKFDTMVSSKIEFVLSFLNDEYLRKIKKFYRGFPEGSRFDINRAKPMTLPDIQILSTIVTQNGKRLTPAFFEANGIVKDFIEDGPAITAKPAESQQGKEQKEDDREDNKDYNMADPAKSFFGSKKKS